MTFDEWAKVMNPKYHPTDDSVALRLQKFAYHAGYVEGSETAERAGFFGTWIPVADRMPMSGAVVLVAYKNERGLWRRIRAQWIAAKSKESNIDSEIGEYDEATDAYYDPEGWYERINNWDDYSAVVVYEGTPTHWMPLPDLPEDYT